jgi:hypothetical protein
MRTRHISGDERNSVEDKKNRESNMKNNQLGFRIMNMEVKKRGMKE